MIKINNHASDKAGNQNDDSISINSANSVTTIITSRISKTLKSHDGKVGGSTTMSSRTITRTNKSINANVHPLDLTGVDGATVMSAGRGSRPRVESFSSNANAHGVFGIDTLNILPTHSDLLKWISDSDSLIKEFNLWSVQNQVENSCCQASPDCCDYASMEIAGEESLNNHNCNENISKDRAENTAACPEMITIIHAPILSQKSEASHV